MSVQYAFTYLNFGPHALLTPGRRAPHSVSLLKIPSLLIKEVLSCPLGGLVLVLVQVLVPLSTFPEHVIQIRPQLFELCC